MTRICITCLFLLLTFLIPAVADNVKAPASGMAAQWTVISVRVVRPHPNDVKGRLGVGLSDPGVRIDPVLHLPGQSIVSIDENSSQVTRFVDDKGLDLLNPQKDERKIRTRGGLVGFSIQASDDARHWLIPMEAPGLPSQGASKIRVQGSLVVLVGRNEKVLEKKNVLLAKGVDLEVGVISKPRDPFGGTIGAPKKTKSSKGLLMQEFVGEKAFKSLVFLDAQGKELPVAIRRNSLSDRRPNKDQAPTYSALFSPREEADRCSAVRLTYFDSVEKLTIPFDLEIGLGLP